MQRYVDANIYDVVYHVNQEDKPAGYEEFSSEQVWENDRINLPTSQNYAGWNFNGWYKNSDFTGTKYSSYTYINADTDFYGEYTKKSYTAYFRVSKYDDQGNYIDSSMDSSTVRYGDTNYAIAVDVPEGWSFDGWYYDASFTNPVDFSDPNSILPQNSSSSMKNFYARLIQTTYPVYFNIVSTKNPDYSLSTPIRVGHGDTVPNPGLNNTEDYIFNGWYTDQQLGMMYSFNTPVTGELQLYAEWTPNVIVIDEAGIHYPGGVINDAATYNQNTNTLALNNYSGGPINIINISNEVTVVVDGNNAINAGYGIYSSAPLDIKGDGKIDINYSPDVNVDDYRCIIESESDIKLNVDINIIGTSDHNYHDGICSSNGNVTIDGNAVNVSVGEHAIKAKNIILNGGQIDVISTLDNKGSALRTYHYDDYENGLIYINGAEVSINNHNSDGQCHDDDGAESRYFKIDKGSLNTPCSIWATDVTVLNGGTTRVREIHTMLFNQNGGELSIIYNDGYEDSGIASDYAMFSGGTTAINNSTAGIVAGSELKNEEYEGLARRAKRIGGVMPKNAPLEITGGDIIVSSGIIPIAVFSVTSTDDLTTQIYLSDNMTKDPDYAVLSQVLMYEDQYATAFSDGEDIVIDYDAETFKHAIKAVHIYAKEAPAPNTDEENNPNTLDFQIVGLAGGVFLAVMTQGMIIADLYRRLHGYEEEIEQY